MSVCSDRGWFMGRWTASYQVYWPLLACTEINTINHCEWESERGRGKFQDYGFRSFAVFWMFYSFFLEIPRRLNCMYRRFGTHCSIFIGADNTNEEQTVCSETMAYKIQTPGNHPKDNIQTSTILCQHSPELIKITQTFVGMSGPRVTTEIDPPPLPVSHLHPFPIRLSKLGLSSPLLTPVVLFHV